MGEPRWAERRGPKGGCVYFLLFWQTSATLASRTSGRACGVRLACAPLGARAVAFLVERVTGLASGSRRFYAKWFLCEGGENSGKDEKFPGKGVKIPKCPPACICDLSSDPVHECGAEASAPLDECADLEVTPRVSVRVQK